MLQKLRLEKVDKPILLIILTVICYLCVVYTIMTYGQTAIHSDAAGPFRFYEAMLESKQIYPDTWNAVNGEAYIFTRLPLNVLLCFLFNNKVLAIVVTNVLVYTISMISFIWFAKCFIRNDAWMIFIPVFSVFLCGEAARGVMYFPAAYCGFIFIFSVCFSLFWKSFDQTGSRIKTLVIHSILLLLMLACGKRHVAEYLLPLVATVIAYVIFIKRNDRLKTLEQSSLKIFIPAALGFGLYKYICAFHNMNFGANSNPKLSFEITAIIDRVINVFRNLFSIFGYSEGRNVLVNIAAVVICIFICVIVPVLQAIEYKKLNENELVFAIFCLMHNGVLFLAIVLGDMSQPRYLLSSVFLLVMLSSNYCYKKLKCIENERLRLTVIILFCVISLFYCRDLLKLTQDWKAKLEERRQMVAQLEALGITKGYSTFWLGYPIEAYSNGNITFGAFDISDVCLFKEYSNCDSRVYDYKEGHSCVIFTEEENAELVDHFCGDFLTPLLTKPTGAFEISSPHIREFYGTDKLIVYVFENDVCDRLTDGLWDGKLNPREMYFNMLGTREENVLYMAPGGLIQGPYRTIAPGEYSVKYKGKDIKDCDVDVVSESSQDNIHYEVVSRKKNEIVLKMTIDNYIEDFQLYMTNTTDKDVEFYEIVIEKK